MYYVKAVKDVVHPITKITYLTKDKIYKVLKEGIDEYYGRDLHFIRVEADTGEINDFDYRVFQDMGNLRTAK